jgi:hypothetical protein
MSSPDAPELSPEHAEWLRAQEAVLARSRIVQGAMAIPYYAYFRVRMRDRERDFVLGARTHIASELQVLDWRTAPLADAFFNAAVGDAFEVAVDDRLIVGTLLERTLVEFADGTLVALRRDGTELRREGSRWRAIERPPLAFLRRSGARPNATRAPVEVVLDEHQDRAVRMEPHRSMLVLGEAGFGKTTVALHRLAHLYRQSRGDFYAAVIVPTEGLRRLSASLLERMGISGVETWTFDQWAAMQAHRAFRGLPKRESEDAPAGTVTLKRHPALRDVLATFASEPEQSPRADLWRLFGDPSRLSPMIAASGGIVTHRAVADTVRHTSIQFDRSTEAQYGDADPDRLKTADGRSIDDGTPTSDAGTIDVEDYPVLFELDRLRADRSRRPSARFRTYDCIVLDEAQEFAPLELALVGRSRKRSGTLIVAGDGEQQIDPTISFQGWDSTMAALGLEDYERVTLKKSYRCPEPVTELARRLLDPSTPRRLPESAAPSIAVRRWEYECHQVFELATALRELRDQDGAATVAVLCRSPEAATSLGKQLERTVPVRVVFRGDFDFRAGINVTAIAEVKGLEFDYVVVPDCVPALYPDAPESRRTLYVAVTRASLQLLLGALGKWSPVVPLDEEEAR